MLQRPDIRRLDQQRPRTASVHRRRPDADRAAGQRPEIEACAIFRPDRLALLDQAGIGIDGLSAAADAPRRARRDIHHMPAKLVSVGGDIGPVDPNRHGSPVR